MRKLDVEPLEGYHPDVGLLLATLQESTKEYRRYLADLPDEAITYQARSGGHSIGGLLLHMADVELYWVLSVGAGRRIPRDLLPKYECDQYGADWPSPPSLSLEEYVAILDKVRDITLVTARDFHPDTIITRKSWKAELSHRWILGHVIAHDSYHGGQAVVLRDLYEARA
jgi:uncharacterized damage-inducible protein DinB